VKSDVRIREVKTFLVGTRCRTPLKFGAVVVEKLPIAYAHVTVENRSGQVAAGWGAMFLMDLWAWPTSRINHEAKNRVMCDLFDAYGKLLANFNRFAHPIEIFMETKADLRQLATEISEHHTPGEELPFLGTLVSASPLDHAIHDAFGRVNEIDSYHGYGPEHLDFDLSHYLGKNFTGRYPSQFIRDEYVPEIPVVHLVGGLDLLHREEVSEDLPRDGFPSSLDDWIKRDGVYCLKIKLRGDDLGWDVERTIAVSHVYREVQADSRPDLPPQPYLTVDTNEQCESPEYIMNYLSAIKDYETRVFDEIVYVEQPTERDLQLHRWDMREISKLKPVLVDESLTSLSDFALAQELGWSGIAIKSCKCLSSNLLFIPLAAHSGIPYSVQDLTNPSIALLESVGLAARTRPILGVEANSRQFFPETNEEVATVHPDLCRIRNGVAKTKSLGGTGLGLRVKEIIGLKGKVGREDVLFRQSLT
jgi:L-alanine-DL-glutamate epimerase-like enolase superfamily enzyme